MASCEPLITTDLASLFPLVNKGKVRDVYKLDEKTLFIVTTDRISAFDVNLATPIPQKGALLTLLTAHWAHILTTHLPHLRTHVHSLSLPPQLPSALHHAYLGRSMQVSQLRPFKIEAIVRAHLAYEAFNSYCCDDTVCGIPIEVVLDEGDAFPRGPIYTPSTKAAVGEHDVDITEAEAARIVGEKYAGRIKELAMEVFSVAYRYALQRGLVLVDTKFEFGLDVESDEVVLMDEILTPESSRFWFVEGWRVGKKFEGVDKQYLRDWLCEKDLDGVEGVVLPEEVVSKTMRTYGVAFERLVGKSFGEAMRELREKEDVRISICEESDMEFLSGVKNVQFHLLDISDSRKRSDDY
ncbi:short chain dehydrogenase atnD [Physcia stellaris]|nr:short chain dehydrogenase atnD [Physcia stellaris]